MKLAIVTHNILTGDGQGRVNYELVRYLLGQGIEVHMVADKVAPDLEEMGATWVPVHPGGERVDLVKVWRFRQLADRLLGAVAARYDAVLACGVVTSQPHTINAVHFVHGTWLRSPFHASKVRAGLNGQYQRVFSTLNARWERHTFDQADAVVAVSEMVREELVAIGVPPEKVTVVVNGVDLAEFAPGPADRRALGLPEGVPLGLFVGDIRSPIKNLDTVLEVLPEVPALHLAVVGRLRNSPYPALAARLGLLGRVHFLGFRRDIAELMRAADFFVLVSRRDSCPLVLLEAMASGLPIITARTVGTSNLVTPHCGFVLARPDDRAALRDGLRRLAENPAVRATMGAAVRAVAERHSWEAMGRRYLNLLETCLRRDDGVEPCKKPKQGSDYVRTRGEPV